MPERGQIPIPVVRRAARADQVARDHLLRWIDSPPDIDDDVDGSDGPTIPWNPSLARYGAGCLCGVIASWRRTWGAQDPTSDTLGSELPRLAAANFAPRPSAALDDWLRQRGQDFGPLSPVDAARWLAAWRGEASAARRAGIPRRLQGLGAWLPSLWPAVIVGCAVMRTTAGPVVFRQVGSRVAPPPSTEAWAGQPGLRRRGSRSRMCAPDTRTPILGLADPQLAPNRRRQHRHLPHRVLLRRF